MKRGAAILMFVAALTAAPNALAAEEGRFDAQVFRPLAAPRDLVMVPKSEVIGHLSPVLGIYWDAALDPLALAVGGTGKTLDAVGARLQVTPILGVGLFDWVELTMAIPFVAWQTSDNLRSIGTEGEVKSSPSLGDIRLSSKLALPFMNRKDEVKSGFGLALAGNVNLPTGDPLAFTSDGAISGGVSVIADYRFNFGLPPRGDPGAHRRARKRHTQPRSLGSAYEEREAIPHRSRRSTVTARGEGVRFHASDRKR